MKYGLKLDGRSVGFSSYGWLVSFNFLETEIPCFIWSMQDSLTYLFCNKFVNCCRYLFHFSWVFCKLYTVRFLYYKEKKSEVALYRSILKDFSLESWFKRETDQRPFRDLLQKHWTLFLKVLQFIISVFRERIRNWGQLAFKSESSLVCLYIQ